MILCAVRHTRTQQTDTGHIMTTLWINNVQLHIRSNSVSDQMPSNLRVATSRVFMVRA